MPMQPTGPPVPPFHRFLEENRVAVYRFLLVTAGPQDADDCLQETFLSALRAYPRLKNGTNLRSWVLTIATRKAIDSRRSRRRRPLPVSDLSSLGVFRAAAGDRSQASPGPEDAIDGSEGGLWGQVRSLPARQRAALVHRFVLDLPYSQIAEVMGGSEQTARANVHQAMKKLRAGRRTNAREVE